MLFTFSLESIQSEEKKKVKEGIVKGMENLLKVAQEKGRLACGGRAGKNGHLEFQ